jgi:hypothetical protein
MKKSLIETTHCGETPRLHLPKREVAEAAAEAAE